MVHLFHIIDERVFHQLLVAAVRCVLQDLKYVTDRAVIYILPKITAVRTPAGDEAVQDLSGLLRIRRGQAVFGPKPQDGNGTGGTDCQAMLAFSASVPSEFADLMMLGFMLRIQIQQAARTYAGTCSAADAALIVDIQSG